MLSLRKEMCNGVCFLVPVRDLPERQSYMKWDTRPFDIGIACALLRHRSTDWAAEAAWELLASGMVPALAAFHGQTPGQAVVYMRQADRWAGIDICTRDVLKAAQDTWEEWLDEQAVEKAILSGAQNSCSLLDFGAATLTHRSALLRELPRWLSENGRPKNVLLTGPVADLPCTTEVSLSHAIAMKLYEHDDWHSLVHLACVSCLQPG